MPSERSSDLSERSQGRFPPTDWSAVVHATGQDYEKASAALQRLCELYRPAIVLWFQGRLASFHDAEDEAQKFLGRRFSGDFLKGFEPRQGVRFRSWLYTCLRHQLFDRRPPRPMEPLNEGDSVNAAGPALASDALLDAGIARQIDERVRAKVSALWRSKGHENRYHALEPLLLEFRPESGSYVGPAAQCGLTEKQAQRISFDLRQDYHSAFEAEVRELCLPGEHVEEARYLRGLLLSDHTPDDH